ncbi:MAG: hypothetical protein OXT01_16325, partial [Rhodospirillaceae bacterium]|nr:hypothetical protein [Rhodospirillaceae bacterium]
MSQTQSLPSPDYEVIVIGAGVAGIYQIKRLVDLGVNATVLEAAGGLGDPGEGAAGGGRLLYRSERLD